MEPFNGAERLHCADGPALKFRDGYALYVVHGVTVPDFVVENPNSITYQMIESEQNKEVQRVMVDFFGRKRYLSESGAEKISQDDWGILWQKPSTKGGGKQLFVEVVNSTAEPDGTFKDYILCVHPELCPIYNFRIVGGPQKLTALNAVASTFGLTGEEYVMGLTHSPSGTPEMAIALKRMS